MRDNCAHIPKSIPLPSIQGAVQTWATHRWIWVRILNLRTWDVFLNLHEPQLPHLYSGDKGAPCFLVVSWE